MPHKLFVKLSIDIHAQAGKSLRSGRAVHPAHVRFTQIRIRRGFKSQKMKCALPSETLRYRLSILLRGQKLNVPRCLNRVFGESVGETLNYLDVRHLAISTEHARNYHCTLHSPGTSLICIGWFCDLLYLRASSNLFSAIDRIGTGIFFLLLCEACSRLKHSVCQCN